MGDTWQCPNCHDVMGDQFQRSHELICALITRMLQDDVDRIIEWSS